MVGNSTGIDASSNVEQLRRIANLLALLATKGEAQAEKILTLTAAGFSIAEVAVLLRATPNTVSVAIYRSKSKKKKDPGARRKRGDQ